MSSQSQTPWKHMIWSAIGGAVAMAFMGFYWGGWYTTSQANRMAKMEAQAELVRVLSPICVANFKKSDGASEKLAALKAIRSNWQRETFVREGKWALIGQTAESGVVDACAEALYNL